MENKIHFDRSRQPETVIPERLEVPEACEYRTASGVRIYVLPAPEYGVVRLSFVFRAGSSWQKVPFCASATVNNLAEGSRDMTARQIAERLDYYGSWFDVSMDRDWSVVTFVCLSKFFDKTLEVARRIMLEPEFPQEELRVYCDQEPSDAGHQPHQGRFQCPGAFRKVPLRGVAPLRHLFAGGALRRPSPGGCACLL